MDVQAGLHEPHEDEPQKDEPNLDGRFRCDCFRCDRLWGSEKASMGAAGGLRARWGYPSKERPKGGRTACTVESPEARSYTGGRQGGGSVAIRGERSGLGRSRIAEAIARGPTSGSDGLPVQARQSRGAASHPGATRRGWMSAGHPRGRDQTARPSAAGIGRGPGRASRACPGRRTRSRLPGLKSGPQRPRVAAKNEAGALWTHRGWRADGGRECRDESPSPPRPVSRVSRCVGGGLSELSGHAFMRSW